MGWSPEHQGGPTHPARRPLGRGGPQGPAQNAVGEGVARWRLGREAEPPACGHGQGEDVDPVVDQADRGAGARRAPTAPAGAGRLVDVDGGHPLGEAPDVPAGGAGELLVHREPVDVGADGSRRRTPGSVGRSRTELRRVVGPDHEAHRHLVVRVEVGVVVAAHGQGHQGPAGNGSGDLETGGVHDPLGGLRPAPGTARPTGRPAAPRPGARRCDPAPCTSGSPPVTAPSRRPAWFWTRSGVGGGRGRRGHGMQYSTRGGTVARGLLDPQGGAEPQSSSCSGGSGSRDGSTSRSTARPCWPPTTSRSATRSSSPWCCAAG